MSEPKPGTGTEEAKDMELDQQPRPNRKADSAFSELDQTEQAKRKGQRKVK